MLEKYYGACCAVVKTVRAAVLICFVAGAVPSWAHAPSGEVFKAFQFPAGFEPAVDGQLDDWRLVGDAYRITSDDLHDLIGGSQTDVEDFSATLFVGWSKEQNRLYIAAQVSDDIHQIDRPAGTASTRIFLDDALEVFVDADHSGGQFANFSELSPEEQAKVNGTQASHFVLAGPPPDEDFFVNYSAAAWYALADGPYTEAAVVYEGQENGRGIVRYEMSLVPFDRIDVSASFLSVEHRLQESEIIGFNVEFNDFDIQSDLLDAKWSLSGELNSYRFSERFADLMLMPLEGIFVPTVVEQRSWGAVKKHTTAGN